MVEYEDQEAQELSSYDKKGWARAHDVRQVLELQTLHLCHCEWTKRVQCRRRRRQRTKRRERRERETGAERLVTNHKKIPSSPSFLPPRHSSLLPRRCCKNHIAGKTLSDIRGRDKSFSGHQWVDSGPCLVNGLFLGPRYVPQGSSILKLENFRFHSG